MKVVVVIPCHNQADTVGYSVARLLGQTQNLDRILVIDDHSDPPLELSADSRVEVVRTERRGRSSTRNLGIKLAYERGADVTVFLDGDACPDDPEFLATHVAQHLGGAPRIVFGMRKHVHRPRDFKDTSVPWTKDNCIPVRRLPSDLLTGNMDNLANGEPLDYRDLRVLSGSVAAWRSATGFDERCDLLLSGMITWSCNFSMSRRAVETLRAFMDSTYCIDGWFDDTVFNDGWGYEDVAFGLDAHFAGVEIALEERALIRHFMHDRSDELSSHIVGRHRIMERYRHLYAGARYNVVGTVSEGRGILVTSSGVAIAVGANSVTVDGRYFKLPDNVLRAVHEAGQNALLVFRGKIYVNGFVFDEVWGTFGRSLLGRILHAIL